MSIYVYAGGCKDDMIAKWEEKSRDFIENFLLLFGRERLSTIWNESKGRIMSALSPPSSPLRDGSPASSHDEEESEEYEDCLAPPKKSPRFSNGAANNDFSDDEDEVLLSAK